MPGRFLRLATLFVATATLGATPSPTPEETERIERGEVLVTQIATADGSGLAYRVAGLVEAPPEAIFPVVRDCEGMAEFMPSIARSELREAEGSHQSCYIEVSMPFPLRNLWSVSRTMGALQADGGFVHQWSLMSGNYLRNQGSWWAMPWGESGGQTLLVYEIELKMNTLVPDFVVRLFQKRTIPGILRAVRDKVHTAHAP